MRLLGSCQELLTRAVPESNTCQQQDEVHSTQIISKKKKNTASLACRRSAVQMLMLRPSRLHQRVRPWRGVGSAPRLMQAATVDCGAWTGRTCSSIWSFFQTKKNGNHKHQQPTNNQTTSSKQLSQKPEEAKEKLEVQAKSFFFYFCY